MKLHLKLTDETTVTAVFIEIPHELNVLGVTV